MYKSFKEIPIWQEAMIIAEEIFKMTNNLRNQRDQINLINQIVKCQDLTPYAIDANQRWMLKIVNGN